MDLQLKVYSLLSWIIDPVMEVKHNLTLVYHRIRANAISIRDKVDSKAMVSVIIALTMMVVDYQHNMDMMKTVMAAAIVVAAIINTPEVTNVKLLVPDPYLMLLTPVSPLLTVTIIMVAATVTTYTKFHEPPKLVKHSSEIGEWIFKVYSFFAQPEMEIEYIGQPDFKTQIFDQYSVMTEVDQLIDWFNSTNNTKIYGFYFLLLMSTVSLLGLPAGLLEIMIYFIYQGSEIKGSIDKPVLARGGDIRKQNGIYRLQTLIWGSIKHRGIGYIDDGTFYTRYHVTLGMPLTIDGAQHQPCYINKATDQIAYGKPPKWAAVKDGEEVVVALAGNYTNRILMYRSHVTVLDSNKIVLRGNKSQMGVSGSPIFKEVDTEVVDSDGVSSTLREYRIVGTIGWFADYDPEEKTRNSKVGTEVFAEEPLTHDFDTPLVQGQTTQLFMHPGAGKTRKVMPVVIHNGLNRMGRVYVTGPSKVVCEELYEATQELYPGKVALMTSNADTAKRGSVARPIVIAAHATMLNMLLNGNSVVSKAGCWVVDEAHMGNTRTQCLKHYLRDRVKRKGEISLEMTATGYNFRDKTLTNKVGSNYHIEEQIRTEQDMINDIVDDGKDRLAIVFVTSINGREPSSARSLSIALGDTEHLILSRETFQSNYTRAKAMTKGVILTTDISECGANFNEATIVYDFQKSPKPVNHRGNTAYESVIIDKGQKTQRRGRVGRRKEGIYVSPGYELPDVDIHRVEHKDTALFCRSLNIAMDDIQPTEAYGNKTLTPQQIAAWMDLSEGSIESPLTVDLLINHDGRPRRSNELENNLKDWRDGDDAVVQHSKELTFTVTFWDARDREILTALAAKCGKLGNVSLAKHDKLIDKTTKMVTRLKNRATNWFGPGLIQPIRAAEDGPMEDEPAPRMLRDPGPEDTKFRSVPIC